jgi:hypothetical protein
VQVVVVEQVVVVVHVVVQVVLLSVLPVPDQSLLLSSVSLVFELVLSSELWCDFVPQELVQLFRGIQFWSSSLLPLGAVVLVVKLPIEPLRLDAPLELVELDMLEEVLVLPEGAVVADVDASAKSNVCVAGEVLVTLKLIVLLDVWLLLGATSEMT